MGSGWADYPKEKHKGHGENAQSVASNQPATTTTVSRLWWFSAVQILNRTSLSDERGDIWNDHDLEATGLSKVTVG